MLDAGDAYASNISEDDKRRLKIFDLSLSISAFYFTILTATGLGALTGRANHRMAPDRPYVNVQ